MQLANVRGAPLLVLLWAASFYASAADEENSLDFQSSQAVFRAVEACRADGCELKSYRIAVKRDGQRTEVVLLGKTPSAYELFSGTDVPVTERHYLIDRDGQTIVRKWYGK